MSDTIADGPTRPTNRPPDAPAGALRAAVLLSCMTFPVLAAVLIAPVQPQIAAAFATTPGVAVLVPALLTVPGLVVGLLSPVAGRLLDRFGRVGLLTGALVMYAVFGTVPLWIDSLPLIVATRFVVGLADAAIMTAVATLVGDLWSGPARDRIFGLTTVVTSVSAVLFLAVGGLLGASDWRVPFTLYASAVVVAVLVRLVLREPAALSRVGGEPLPRLRWRPLLVPCLVSLFGGLMFSVPLVELSYRLVEVGVTAAAVIGLLSALAAVGTAAGSITFGLVGRFGPARLLPVAFGLAGAGSVLLGLGSSAVPVAAGALVASAGCGLLLPTMLTWAVGQLRTQERGRGSGWWTASFSIAQFALPLLVLALSGLLGGLGGVIALLGVLSLVMAAGSPALVRISRVPRSSGDPA